MKCGAGCYIGIGLVGVVGFIVLDHFVLKDKFGIWLAIMGALGRPQVTSTPRGGQLDVTGKSPEEVTDIQENIESKASKMRSDYEEAVARQS